MTGSLPKLIDPLEFVERKKRIQGSIPLAGMTRLGDTVLNSAGQVSLDLSFAREGRHAVISGHIKTDLILECQCCLEPMVWPVASDLRLGIVSSLDEADRLPDSLEPFLLSGDDRVSLDELVEDELLLSIPPVPQHSGCVSLAERPVDPSRSPFAALAQWRGNT